MVEHPRLFIDSLNERERERAAKQLKGGPEQQAVAELGHLQAQLERVRKVLGAAAVPAGRAAGARLPPRARRAARGGRRTQEVGP